MPHKRAKRSVREEARKERGTDNPPTKTPSSNEPIPKSIARVLDAERVRKEWRKGKGKRASEDTGEHDKARSGKRRKVHAKDSKDKGKALGLQPGETLAHFNRRVESDMAPLVRSAMHTSAAHARRIRHTEGDAKSKASKSALATPDPKPQHKVRPPTRPESPDPPSTSKPKEFLTVSSTAPRRLNDVAQAPPAFTKLLRGATPSKAAGGAGGVLSMAQRARMEEERERAVKRYRELRAAQRAENSGPS